MDVIANFCEVVKEIMEVKGFRNVEQFSKAVGIYRNAVDRWLKGKYHPNVKSIVRLADYYACSTDYLFGLAFIKDYCTSVTHISFAERYAQLVKQNNLSHYYVAKGCGVKAPTITKWLHLGQVPSVVTLVKLTEILNCSLDYLIGRSDKI